MSHKVVPATAVVDNFTLRLLVIEKERNFAQQKRIGSFKLYDKVNKGRLFINGVGKERTGRQVQSGQKVNMRSLRRNLLLGFFHRESWRLGQRG